MVLPLLIGLGFIVSAGFLVYKNADKAHDIIYNITASKNQKQANVNSQQFDLEKSKYNFEENKKNDIKNRGVLNNAFAFVFGETAYSEVFNKTAKPQPPLTGEKKETVASFSRLGKTARNHRGLRNG